MKTASEAARHFSQYAKTYHAGAFATPMNKELDQAITAGYLHDQDGCLILEASPIAKHAFNDFTGHKLAIPKGARVARFVAPTNGVPSLKHFQVVYAYMEDRNLVRGLKAQKFNVAAVKVSAASELIGLWTQGPSRTYPAHDLATMTELPLTVPAKLRTRILGEIKAIAGWKDDDPYYHKGEWSHVSLRGYKPADPHYGVKPSEMSRNWHKEHPDESKLTKPDWTVLCKRTPGLVELIESVQWWEKFDRVRLLRLTTGQLKRHTDITDREAGTRDGQLCRFHLPLVTDPTVRAVAWDLAGNKYERHWAAWHLYYLDQRKPHAALNPSNVERVHLVVDVVATEKVREAVADASRRDYTVGLIVAK